MNDDKLPFVQSIRRLRIDANKKQHEIAFLLGIAVSSYSNVESSNHKRISRDRVLKLARYYALDPAQTAQLVAEWEALPASPFSSGRSEEAKAKRRVSARAELADLALLSLCEVTTLLVDTAPDPEALCSCGPPAEDLDFGAAPEPCEICRALQRIGTALQRKDLTGWTNRDAVIAQLASAQSELDERVAAQDRNTP